MNYLRLSPDEARAVRLKIALLDDGRCREVDDDGCRCLVRQHKHLGPHDFSHTRWDDAPRAQAASRRDALERGDQPAATEVFKQCQPFIKGITRRFHGPDADELFSAAQEGFMLGLKKFRPGRGADFKTWMSFWVRAYVGRCTRQWLTRGAVELGGPALVDPNGENEDVEVDHGDDGRYEEALIDGLAMRQMEGIVDGLKDRQIAKTLQLRMQGLTFMDCAKQAVGYSSHERARQLELHGIRLAKAKAMRAVA